MKRNLIAHVPDDLRPKWIWFDPGPRSSYPRMGPQDAKLIDLAWRLGVIRADAVAYDAPVGRIRVTWVHESDVERQLYEELLKPRADMVTLHKNTLTVWEVKPTVNPHSIGQAITYRDLARYEVPKHYKIRAGILAWTALDELLEVAITERIQVVLMYEAAKQNGIDYQAVFNCTSIADLLEGVLPSRD